MPFDITMLAITWDMGRYSMRPIVHGPENLEYVMSLIKDPRFREMSVPSYLDYVAVLSVEEVMELAKSHYEKYPPAIWEHEDLALKRKEALEKFKTSLNGVTFVVVHVAEG